jgi:hypothetical protein
LSFFLLRNVVLRHATDIRQTTSNLQKEQHFQMPRLFLDTTTAPYRLLFNGEQLQEMAAFREFWSIDLHLDPFVCSTTCP